MAVGPYPGDALRRLQEAELEVLLVIDGVCAKASLLDGFLGKEIHLVVDAGCSFELAVLAVRLELMTEGLDLSFVRDEVMEVLDLLVERLPLDVVDTTLQRRAHVVVRRPTGIIVVVARSGPLARPVVEPEGPVARVACTENGGLASRRDGIDDTLSFRRHLQFVADGRDGEMLGRRLLVGMYAGVGLVVHAEDGHQRLPIEPPIPHDAVGVGTRAGHQACHSRGRIGRAERILRLRIEAALLLEAKEAPLSVERREGVKVVAAQLVDDDVHYQRGHPRRLLSVGTRHGKQHDERGKQSVSIYHQMFTFCYASLFSTFRLSPFYPSRDSS